MKTIDLDQYLELAPYWFPEDEGEWFPSDVSCWDPNEDEPIWYPEDEEE